MRPQRDTLEARLAQIVHGTPWLLEVLGAVQDAGPPHAYVAAGAIRNAVWDSLHGRFPDEPAADVDVVHFEPVPDEIDWSGRLSSRLAGYLWEVTNQATVHDWQSVHYGRPVAPYASLAAALESWPETATAVGVRLSGPGDVEVVAPFGLVDLFQLRLRPSPGLLDPETYRTRVRSKAWQTKWPGLRVLTPEDAERLAPES